MEEIWELLTRVEPFLVNNDTDSLNFLEEIKAVYGAEELAYHIEEYNFDLALDSLETLRKRLVHSDE